MKAASAIGWNAPSLISVAAKSSSKCARLNHARKPLRHISSTLTVLSNRAQGPGVAFSQRSIALSLSAVLIGGEVVMAGPSRLRSTHKRICSDDPSCRVPEGRRPDCRGAHETAPLGLHSAEAGFPATLAATRPRWASVQPPSRRSPVPSRLLDWRLSMPIQGGGCRGPTARRRLNEVQWHAGSAHSRPTSSQSALATASLSSSSVPILISSSAPARAGLLPVITNPAGPGAAK
jgi:hypothetical protein